MWYFIEEEKAIELFNVLKSNGLIYKDVPFEHFKQIALDVLPPGEPDRDHDRNK